MMANDTGNVPTPRFALPLPPSSRALLSPLSGTEPHLVAPLKPARSPLKGGEKREFALKGLKNTDGGKPPVGNASNKKL